MFRRYNANGIRQNEDAEQTMQALKVVETETCNIAKEQEESKEVDLPKLESDDAKVELPKLMH